MSLRGLTRFHNLLIRSQNEEPRKWQNKAFSIANTVVTKFNTATQKVKLTKTDTEIYCRKEMRHLKL